jgi:hypothetical protein
MRRAVITLFCLGLLGFAVATAQAQSLYGPGGLFLHPTADIPPRGQVTLGAIVLPQRIPETPGLHTIPTWGTVSLDYGLTEDIEIGATNLMITDFSPSWGGFFKYRFLRENGKQPAVAAGFTYTGFGDNDSRAAFLAARKQLTKNSSHPIIGHLGVEYINKLAGLPYNQFQPYGGFEVGLAPRWILIAEARPRGNSDFKVSTALSLSYQYGKGNRLVATWANTGQSTQPRFGFGVGFTIGTRR